MFVGSQGIRGTYMGKEFFVPCRFITESTRHLKEMLSIGAAKYLFPLDADHAHLGVPAEVWAKKYSQLPSDQILFALLREPTLVALYHTAEHLEISDRKTGRVNEEAKAWRRNATSWVSLTVVPFKFYLLTPWDSAWACLRDTSPMEASTFWPVIEASYFS
jgi:hypothetical protein